MTTVGRPGASTTPASSGRWGLECIAPIAVDALSRAVATGAEPRAATYAVAVTVIRASGRERSTLVALLRRLVLRMPAGSEAQARAQRALARSGAAVAPERLEQALASGRVAARIALAVLGELAVRGSTVAHERLSRELNGVHRADAALWLSFLCTDQALDTLAGHLRTPGLVGLHASAALFAVEQDPFAFESLLERLCSPEESLNAALALWGADGTGLPLVGAENALRRWTARGVARARVGQRTAAIVLAAKGQGTDLGASLGALSGKDELAVHAAQGAWALGECERARNAAYALLERAPRTSALAFKALCRWADDGDEPALALVRRVLKHRPIELSRAAMLEALAHSRRRALARPVTDALTRGDEALALEAARVVARRLEPASPLPALWL